MLSENDFSEFVEAISKRPTMYTPTGSFYEVISFLEGYGLGGDLGGYVSHYALSAFYKWLAGKYNFQAEIVDWRKFRELFDSDSQALENLSVLYKEYIETL